MISGCVPSPVVKAGLLAFAYALRPTDLLPEFIPVPGSLSALLLGWWWGVASGHALPTHAARHFP